MPVVTLPVCLCVVPPSLSCLTLFLFPVYSIQTVVAVLHLPSVLRLICAAQLHLFFLIVAMMYSTFIWSLIHLLAFLTIRAFSEFTFQLNRAKCPFCNINGKSCASHSLQGCVRVCVGVRVRLLACVCVPVMF